MDKDKENLAKQFSKSLLSRVFSMFCVTLEAQTFKTKDREEPKILIVRLADKSTS